MKVNLIILVLIAQIMVCPLIFAQVKDNKGVGNINDERKIALVIGNTNYDASIGGLKNPVNDAKDVADALRRLGFTIVGGKAHLDVNRKQMLELIREFGRQIKLGGIGFFYFSGHGVQVNKENYIIPITDALEYEDDAETEAINVDVVAKEMQSAGNRLNILVLDACRNNELRKRGRNIEQGLTEPKLKPRGTFIAFAADDGQTASENVRGRNGLFTQEFLKNLEAPNVRLDDIFRQTRNEVERLSNGGQQPMFFDKTNEAITLNSTGISNENAVIRPQTNDSSVVTQTENSSLSEATFNYEKEFTFGSGTKEFTVKWSSCGDSCVYAYADKLDGIANSKITDFAEIGDFTAYDRSSRVRELSLSQILVLRNSDGYFALMQIAKISRTTGQLTVRYKVIPDKRQSKWKPDPAYYINRRTSGRVRFRYEDNNGDFAIGEGNERFNLHFGGAGRNKVRLYYNNVVSTSTNTGTVTVVGDQRTSDLEVGDQITVFNKNGWRAVIKIIEAKTIGYNSDTDEVVFEYEIHSK